MKNRLLLMGISLIAGCSLAPRYNKPAVSTPAAYQELKDWKPAQPQDDVPRGKWWMAFKDPQLNALVEKVDVGSQTLLAAEANYRGAQALVAQARGALFPTLGASLGATRSGGSSGGVSATGTVIGGRGDATTYDLGLNASWDTDLFGRLHNTLTANRALAQASQGDLESTRLLIQSQVVLNYVQLRVADAQKKLFDQSAAAFAKSLELTQNRYKAGLAGRVDVAQAETQVKSTQAQSIDTGIARAQFQHAIAVLLGVPPAELNIPPDPSMAAVVPVIPTGIPSELLERRPDIAAAERRAAAANAQIGVVRAALFPSLTLGATGGFQSSSFANWLTVPSRVWSLGPALAMNLIDFGQRRALTDQAIANYDANAANYRQTVLTAFQGVEDNLAALRTLEAEAVVQADALKAARQAVDLTINQYKSGIVSYLNVVTVQTTQLTNERTVLGIQGRRLVAAAQLVQALGGGWTLEQPAK